MKIDDDSASSVYPVMPPASAKLFNSITNANTVEEFIGEINKCREAHSVMGTSKLRSWIKVLNRLDEILENSVEKNEHSTMKCDYDPIVRKQVIDVVRFTVLLFESTSSRRVYRSFHHILDLLETIDMDILGEVLRLLQTMGKRSKFLTTRVGPAEQKRLASYLMAIARCWDGRLRSVKMVECVKNEPIIPALFPFIFTDGNQRKITIEKPMDGFIISKLANDYMAQLTPPKSLTITITDHSPLYEDRYRLLSSLRMLNNFEIRSHRLKCLVTRLLSVSTLIYCCCQSDENPDIALLHNGFVDELVSILKVKRESECVKEYEMLDQIQTESLSTLCSIVNYESDPKIPHILEELSAGSYHGYLSTMTSRLILDLKEKKLGQPGHHSADFANKFFSFLNIVASTGAVTLARSGLTKTLISYFDRKEATLEYIDFATRISETLIKMQTIDMDAFVNGIDISFLLKTLLFKKSSATIIEQTPLVALQQLSKFWAHCNISSWILIAQGLRKLAADEIKVLNCFIDTAVVIPVSDLYLNTLPVDDTLKTLIREVRDNECSKYSKKLNILLMRYCDDKIKQTDQQTMEELSKEIVVELFHLELKLYENEKPIIRVEAILGKSKQSLIWQLIDKLASKKTKGKCTSNEFVKTFMDLKRITFPAVFQHSHLYFKAYNELSDENKKIVTRVKIAVDEARNPEE